MGGSIAHAQNNVSHTLYASQSSVMPGQNFDIAIEQNIRAGWHTYWRNAGDSGEPLMIEWDAPAGVTVGDLQFPTPKRIYYDPLVNFGHEGAPIYLQNIQIDERFSGADITLNGNASWLVCEEICIPESEQISITIPVGVGESINDFIFDEARAVMPQAVDWPATLSQSDSQARLSVTIPQAEQRSFTDVEIFPYDWGVIATTAKVMSDFDDATVTFSAAAGGRDFSDITDNRFVIRTDHGAYQVTAIIDAAQQEHNTQTTQETQAAQDVAHLSIFAVLAFAFIGGMILNLMPCVFPVLSMKALSLVKLSDQEKSHARASGLAYTAGIILSFLLIAGALIVLKGAGESIGWGFQLQNPYVVTGLATLLFLIGLNLLGVFEVSGRFTSIGSGLTTGNGVKSSFFTGVLATLVATPCTAPFMASAIGYALTQNAFVALSIFAMLGFGLAFPYLLLSFIPAVQKIMPRPGAWMETFKQALSWPMFASALWLVWVVMQQAGDLAALYVLGLFLAIGFMIWFFNHVASWIWRVMILAFLAGAFIAYGSILNPKVTMDDVAFDTVKLQKTLSENPDQPVFVNMTAAWCITCLVNEQTSLSQPAVKDAFAAANVLYMKGDWTNRDAEITTYLESYGRNGVPLYVFYGRAANGSMERPDPIILPQILTPDIILETVKGDQNR